VDWLAVVGHESCCCQPPGFERDLLLIKDQGRVFPLCSHFWRKITYIHQQETVLQNCCHRGTIGMMMMKVMVTVVALGLGIS
jgi:hypothetical protein